MVFGSSGSRLAARLLAKRLAAPSLPDRLTAPINSSKEVSGTRSFHRETRRSISLRSHEGLSLQ